MMEVVVTTGAISRAKLQPNHHHQQINIQFFTGRMPFLSPNQQCQSTEGTVITSQDSISLRGHSPCELARAMTHPALPSHAWQAMLDRAQKSQTR